MNRLSKRLRAVADLVTIDGVLCDVGTDHGYIPIALVKEGRVKKAIAMDLREGPLQRAKEHIAQFGLEEYIQTRLSDGVDALKVGEVQGIVIAGMGGDLVMHILREGAEVCHEATELILQPQSHLAEVRAFLRQEGYGILDEDMVEEDGKFYPMMRVAFPNVGICTKTLQSGFCLRENDAGQNLGNCGSEECRQENVLPEGREAAEILELQDLYGPILLEKKHPVLMTFLEKQHRHLEEILQQLERQPASGKMEERILEVRHKIHCNEAAANYKNWEV